MKKILFLFVYFLSFKCLYAQTVMSSCTAPDSVIAKYRDDAEEIALDRSYEFNSTYKDSIVINKASRDTVLRALLAIYNAQGIPARNTVIDTFNIHYHFSYGLKSIIIFANANIPWMQNLQSNIIPCGNASLDSLINKYNLHWNSINPYGSNNVVLATDSNLNVIELVKIIKALPGVTDSGPALMTPIGSNNIYITTSPGHVDVLYCFRLSRYWLFRVYDNCSVEYIGTSANPDDIYPTAVNEISTINLKLFPNPATDHLNITSKEPIKIYKIFAMDGRMVAEGKVVDNQINIQSLQPSIYTIRLTADKGSSNLRFVKQ